jgi:hypothetical protein
MPLAEFEQAISACERPQTAQPPEQAIVVNTKALTIPKLCGLR